MLTEPPVLEFASTASVARITLNRPEKRNALNRELIGALREALERGATDSSIRVILLRGAGRDFCAGMDLAGLAAGSEAGILEHLADARVLADLFLAMRRHPRPIVAAVHGRALAGGAGLAVACDLVVAAQSAHFRFTEVDLGFVPAIVAAAARRSMSEKHAFELLATGADINAEQALHMGMINQVYDDAVFDDKVEEYIAELAGKSASAVSLTKSLLYHMDGMTFESAIGAGIQTNAIARMTPDARSGFDRFVKQKKR